MWGTAFGVLGVVLLTACVRLSSAPRFASRGFWCAVGTVDRHPMGPALLPHVFFRCVVSYYYI